MKVVGQFTNTRLTDRFFWQVEKRYSNRMPHRFISRRRFIENSVSGLAVGFGLGVESLRATAEIPSTDGLSLKAIGDATHGFGVAILRNGELIAHHNQGGEFSATFQNEDRSVEDHVENWKPSAWTGDA